LRVSKTLSIHWRTGPSEPCRAGSSRRSGRIKPGAVACDELLECLPGVALVGEDDVAGGREPFEDLGGGIIIQPQGDFGHGGGLAREAVTAQLRWSVQMVDSRCPEVVRGEPHTAVADLAGCSGVDVIRRARPQRFTAAVPGCGRLLA
jgi:hypothetical protein